MISSKGFPRARYSILWNPPPVLGFDTKLTGTNDYRDTAGSDIVIITSGIARKPGMSRADLISINAKVIRQVTQNIAEQSPEAVIIMVTNPVDALTWLALETSQFPRQRVFGLSGALDGARLACFIASALGVSVSEIKPCVIGEHGQNMIVVPRLTTVAGRPLSELLSQNKIDALIQRTVNGGAEIVGLLKTGSAFYAPSAAACQLAEAVMLDQPRIIPCIAYLEGEYGISGAVTSVPVKLGQGGIREIVELPLNPEERTALKASAEAVKALMKQI